MTICIRRKEISKSVADLVTASELEKSMRGLMGNQSREYVKTGLAVKNPTKTVDGNLRHNCDVDPFRGLALPMTSPKDIFNFSRYCRYRLCLHCQDFPLPQRKSPADASECGTGRYGH